MGIMVEQCLWYNTNKQKRANTCTYVLARARSHFMSCHITLAAPYGTLTPLPFEAPIHSSNTMGLISIVNPMGSLFRITMLSGSIIRSQF